MEDLQEKTHVWVTKKIAKQLQGLESSELLEQAVKKILNDKKLSLEQEQSLLDESILLFKSACLAHKRELEKVYTEQDEILYKLWQDMGDIGSKVKKHAEELSAVLKPISRDISNIKKELDGLKLYIPSQMVEITESVSKMDEETKTLLKHLLDVGR